MRTRTMKHSSTHTKEDEKKNRTEKLFNDKNYAFKYNNEESKETCDLRVSIVQFADGRKITKRSEL